MRAVETQPFSRSAAMNAEVPILRAGETCWQLARAGRVALIVDAAEYFA
jgi:phospholipase D1/2